jgi:hypothetical protein
VRERWPQAAYTCSSQTILSILESRDWRWPTAARRAGSPSGLATGPPGGESQPGGKVIQPFPFMICRYGKKLGRWTAASTYSAVFASGGNALPGQRAASQRSDMVAQPCRCAE